MPPAQRIETTETPESSDAPAGRCPTLSVVAPVYNEEEGLHLFYDRVVKALEAVVDFEVVLVDDGSTDESPALLSSIAENDERVRVLRLSRNFGHQVAITAGIDNARGEAVVVIDADLQDPPELIVEMLRHWRAGDEVVYATRIERADQPRWKLAATSIYYRLADWLSDTPLPRQTGDFRLLDRRVVNALSSMREENRYLRGMVAWVGFRQRSLEYERDDRAAGESKYTMRKLFGLAFAGITAFSERPLRVATAVGSVVMMLAFAYTIVIVGIWVFDRGSLPAGYASLLAAVLFLAGVQLLTIGVLGTYVGRIYRETKSRPLYLVAEEIRSGGQVPDRDARTGLSEGTAAPG